MPELLQPNRPGFCAAPALRRRGLPLAGDCDRRKLEPGQRRGIPPERDVEPPVLFLTRCCLQEGRARPVWKLLYCTRLASDRFGTRRQILRKLPLRRARLRLAPNPLALRLSPSFPHQTPSPSFGA